MTVWRFPWLCPPANPTPASAGGPLFALHCRHPLTLELTCAGQDRGLQIGLDVARDGGLEPVSVTETRLTRYRHRQCIRSQRSSQNENVDLVAFVRLAARR